MIKKNTRLRIHGIYDISYKEFGVPFDHLNCEAQFLKTSRAAGVSVPRLYGVYQLPICAALVLEFVQGTPFEQSQFQKEDLIKIFGIIRQLRESRLIHGDLRRDDFFCTSSDDVYLVGYLHLMSSVDRALNYDLISAICHLSLSINPLVVLDAARCFFSPAALKGGLSFLSFITERLTDQNRALLQRTIPKQRNDDWTRSLVSQQREQRKLQKLSLLPGR